VTTNEAIDRFLEHGGLSPASQRAYGSDLRSFAAWLDRRGVTLDEVDARVLSDWVAELGSGRDRLAAPSIARRLSAVRSCLRYTFGPAHVPEASLAPRRARRLPDAPKLAEIDDLLHAERHAPRCECGAPILRGSHFCPSCGRRLDAPDGSGASEETVIEPAPRKG